MKILFHIGAAKTGSTSIQLFLTQHRNLLSKAGFFYPLNRRLKHSEFALAASYDINDSIDIYRYHRYKCDHLLMESDMFKHYQSMIKTYLDDFMYSGCHTLLLSDEILPYRCNTIDKLDKLKLFFPQGSKFHFIYYKRLASDIYISLYSTLLKVGQTTISPFDFSLPQDSSDDSAWIASREMFDHSNLIFNISKVFGFESLTVFDYDILRAQFPSHSIVQHFLNSTNIIINAHPQEISNRRLDYIGLFILYLYNFLLIYLSRPKLVRFILERFRYLILIPILELISFCSPFKFPCKYISNNRDSFDRLFDQ